MRARTYLLNDALIIIKTLLDVPSSLLDLLFYLLDLTGHGLLTDSE